MKCKNCGHKLMNGLHGNIWQSQLLCGYSIGNSAGNSIPCGCINPEPEKINPKEENWIGGAMQV